MPKVIVSLVNFNGSKNTLLCLDLLEKVMVKDYELFVVIVDNASEEKFETKREYKNFNLRIIRSSINSGFAGGQNIGIKYGQEIGIDYFIVLNNDVIFESNFLKDLLETFAKEKKCGLVSPKIYFAKGHEFHKNRYQEKDLGKIFWYAGGQISWRNVLASHRGVDEVDRGQYEELERTEFVSGCCIAVKREVFEKIGLFDENYFLYYEDNDLSQRAKKAGFELYYQPKAILWHLNADSTGGSGSALQDYYITRNRLIFGFKFTSLRIKFALVRESLRLIANGRKWQKKGVMDFYLRKFGKGSYGK